ncbi:hypothetical protein ACQB6R_12460 [Propionibacteriaceae bacterium G1746]
MTHQDDGARLSPSLYGDRRRVPWTRPRPVLAFGWLEPGRPYLVGQCPVVVVAALERLEPVDRTRGFHACGFCEGAAAFAGAPHRTLDGRDLVLGSASLAVTVGGNRWVAPNLVLHYITAHGYLPPDEGVRGLGG